MLACKSFPFLQLKSYAVHQSIAASITDEYSAKGENLDTLLDFHKNMEPFLSDYTLSFQLLYPLLVACFVVLLLYQVLDNNKLRYLYYTLEQDNKFLKKNADKESSHLIEKAKISSENLSIYTVIVCSFMFVVYVIMLDCFAVNRRIYLDREIFYSTSGKNNFSSNSKNFEIEYSIVSVILVQDLIVFIVMIAASCFKSCRNCSGKWHHILFGPCCCLAIHSYHILIGFIHTPHHATSILVLYGVLILIYVVTVKIVYYNMFKVIAKCCKKNYESENDNQHIKKKTPKPDVKETTEKKGPNEPEIIRRDPDTDSGGTSGEIDVISVEAGNSSQNSALGTSTTSQVKFCQHKLDGRHGCVLFSLFAVSIILTLFFAYMCFQFVFVPINNAIDDAPDRFLSINQTVIIIFGAAITFKLYQSKKDKTYFDYLVEAQDKQFKDNTEISEDMWKMMSHKDKQKEMASVVLRALLKTSNSQQHNNNPPQGDPLAQDNQPAQGNLNGGKKN